MDTKIISCLVLNKSHKPIGMKDITVTRDFMYYVDRGQMFLVKPIDSKELRPKTK